MTLSIITQKVDNAYWVLGGLSIALLLGISLFVLFCLFRYSRKRNRRPAQIKDHRGLEIAWTVIPTIIVIGLFVQGYDAFKAIRSLSEDAFEVKVTGRMWSWSFEYPGGVSSRELVVPQNRPVKLALASQDVIHSFYLPAMRLKEDAVPGLATYLSFTPDKVGTYDVYCAEFCGQLHSQMLTKLKVVAPAEFDAWYRKAVKEASTEGLTPEEFTKKSFMNLYMKKGCNACHSLDGSKIVGPTLKGLFGSKRKVTVGGAVKEVVADTAFIERAVNQPNAEVAEGYPPLMQPQNLTDADVKLIVDYLSTLK